MTNQGDLRIMTRLAAAGLLCTVALLGCSHSPTQPAAADAAAAPRAQAQIGTFGLDLTTHDPSVRPGDDFYRYADGHWLDSNTIPADRSANTPQAERSAGIVLESSQ